VSATEGVPLTTQSIVRRADVATTPRQAAFFGRIPFTEPSTTKYTDRLRTALVANRSAHAAFRRTKALPTTVGSVAPIWVVGPSSTFVQVSSVLALQTAHANIWIDQSLTTLTTSPSNIAAIGADMENAYASDTAHFGQPEFAANAPGAVGTYQACDASGTVLTGQTTPVIVPPTDGRTNVEVVNSSTFGGEVGGYFTSLNYVPQAAINCVYAANSATPAYSNEAPFIFVGYYGANGVNFEIGEDLVRGTSHELQHLINYVNKSVDRVSTASEASFINEGFSMLAQDLAVPRLYSSVTNDVDDAVFRAKGYLAAPQAVSIYSFLGTDPDASLSFGCSACYGGAYLYQRYLYDRFGGDAYLHAMYASGSTGLAELAAVTQTPTTQLFHDFAIAVDVANTNLATAPYTFAGVNLHRSYTDQFGNANIVALSGPANAAAQPFALGATQTYQQLYGSIAYYAATTSPSANVGFAATYLGSGTFTIGGVLIQH
jgi:hypothetical protein